MMNEQHSTRLPPDTSTQTELTFPTVKGTSLTQQEMILPKDFEGDLNLVLIAFKQEQQEMADSWAEEVKTLTTQHSDLRFYELPTLERYHPAYRWFINRGMRAGIPDESTRALTIVLYLDKAAFREALGLPDEETIYILLVDRNGQVLWRTEGAYGMHKAQLLRKAIEQYFVSAEALDISSI